MCRNKDVREERCDHSPEKRAIQQTKQRRRRADKRMGRAQGRVRALIGATPFRPESADLLRLNSYEPYYDSHEWVEYDDTIQAIAAKHGVEVVHKDTASGLWLDDVEPSGAYEVYSDKIENVHAWAAEIAGRYNQDAVMVSEVTKGGTDRLLTFGGDGQDIDEQAALNVLRAAGIPGGRSINGQLQIISSSDSPITDESLALLRARLGDPTVTNINAEFVDKNDKYAPSGPIKEIQALRQHYAENKGLPKRKSRPHFSEADEIASAMIYEELPHDPAHPKIQESYKAFGQHIAAQHDALVDAGYTFEPWTGQTEQPYANSSEMLADLKENKRLFYYPTEASQDTDGALPPDHPMAAIVKVKDSKGGTKEVMLNDVFRGVHDAIAHGDGNSFGPQGERNAWWAHRECLPREAHLALWNETRAQNTWTNAGPHMRTVGEDGAPTLRKPGTDGWIPLPDRPYAAQKCVNVPAKFT